MESTRAVITADELTPDVAADTALGNIPFNIALLGNIRIRLQLRCTRLRHPHATARRLLIVNWQQRSQADITLSYSLKMQFTVICPFSNVQHVFISQ